MKDTDEDLAGSCEKTWEVVAAKQRVRSRIVPPWGIDFQNIPPRVRQETKAKENTEPETAPPKEANPQVRRCESWERVQDSFKKLSDAACPSPEGRPSEVSASAASTLRSRCSISHLASMAAEFSSIHWSSKEPLSFRRLAARLRRENS